jgi:hypothetical protein
MASSLNVTYTAPYGGVTPTDHGGALLTVNIVGFFPALLSVVLRLYISNRNSETGFAVFKDDLMCYAALVRKIQDCFPYKLNDQANWLSRASL